jgi:hypothetical protein
MDVGTAKPVAKRGRGRPPFRSAFLTFPLPHIDRNRFASLWSDIASRADIQHSIRI